MGVHAHSPVPDAPWVVAALRGERSGYRSATLRMMLPHGGSEEWRVAALRGERSGYRSAALRMLAHGGSDSEFFTFRYS